MELYEQPKYYCTIIENTIRRTASVLSEEKLNTVLNFWNDAREIVIFAGGSTYFVAEDLERKLIKVGKYTFAYNDDYYWMRFSVINAKKDTLFIGITYSGNTKSVIHNLNDARDNDFGRFFLLPTGISLWKKIMTCCFIQTSVRLEIVWSILHPGLVCSF